MVPVKQRRILPFLFAFLVLIPFLARGDGRVFTSAVAVPTTPDQRAMLYFSNDVEKLVIETSFVGPGTNFAWVVPLPSAPKIEAVSENFFPSLNTTYQPKLIYETSKVSFFVLFSGGLASVIIFAHRRRMSLLVFIVGIVVLFFFAAMLLPSMAKARSSGSSVVAGSSVKILDEQRVGIFDTVTLSGADGRDLLEWLNTHHFFTPTNALPVLNRYAAQKWVFAAATIHRENESNVRSQPHPLAFTFRTEKAVYPLQLTGVENGDCSIELFVFGPSRAEADHFKVEYCGKPFVVERSKSDEDLGYYREAFFPPAPGAFRIANTEVRHFALPAEVTTKLAGTLTPRDMESDAWIQWVPLAPVFPTLYSRDAARSVAFDWFVVIFVVGGILLQLDAPQLGLRRSLRAFGILLIVAIGIGGLRWMTLRTTEVHITRGGSSHLARNVFRELDLALEEFAMERSRPGPLTFEELTTNLPQYVKYDMGNCFTGKPLRNEPSPGNITLRSNTNGTTVIWYDLNASPHDLTTFENRTAKANP